LRRPSRLIVAFHPSRGVKPVTGPTIEAAASLGFIGLGVIIFGAALFLAGLVVIAVRR
jgi:hypothetical protein